MLMKHGYAHCQFYDVWRTLTRKAKYEKDLKRARVHCSYSALNILTTPAVIIIMSLTRGHK